MERFPVYLHQTPGDTDSERRLSLLAPVQPGLEATISTLPRVVCQAAGAKIIIAMSPAETKNSQKVTAVPSSP